MVTTKANLMLIASRASKRMIKDPDIRKNARTCIQNAYSDVYQRGNFTIATLTDTEGTILGVGASKRCPTEDEDPTIGYNLSLVRAVEHVMESFVDIEMHQARRKDGGKDNELLKWTGPLPDQA